MPPWLLALMAQIAIRRDVPTLPAVAAQPRSTPPNPQRVMERRGILPQMEATDTARSRRLYEAVEPIYYDKYQVGLDGEAQSIPRRTARALLGIEQAAPRQMFEKESEDAWRLYLGLPQISNSFSVSKFRPSRSSDESTVYLSLPSHYESIVRDLPFLLQQFDSGKSRLPRASDVLGHFTVGRGHDSVGDYISYYDIWDLSPGGKVADYVVNTVGKPFEIYDRIYYDPETLQPVGR